MKTSIVQNSVIFNTDGDILLLKRSDSDIKRPGQWGLVGGHLDKNETFTDGIIREIKEESGFAVSQVKLFYGKTEPSTWKDVNGESMESNVLRLYYSTHVDSFGVTLSDEHSEFCWVSLQESVALMEYEPHVDVMEYIIDNQLEL